MEAAWSGRRGEQSHATREHILQVATRLFTQPGFHATSIESVLQATGLSKGALYHHFASKQKLFEAVLESTEQLIARRLQARADRPADPVVALRAGCRRWLRMARDPTVRQISLIDAPAVVGWQRWREIDEHHGFGLLKESLRAVAVSGRLSEDMVDPIAHMLLAALMEAALLTSRRSDGDPAIAATAAALDELLRRLFSSGTYGIEPMTGPGDISAKGHS